MLTKLLPNGPAQKAFTVANQAIVIWPCSNSFHCCSCQLPTSPAQKAFNSSSITPPELSTEQLCLTFELIGYTFEHLGLTFEHLGLTFLGDILKKPSHIMGFKGNNSGLLTLFNFTRLLNLQPFDQPPADLLTLPVGPDEVSTQLLLHPPAFRISALPAPAAAASDAPPILPL